MKTKTLPVLLFFALLLAACSGPSSPPSIQLELNGETVSGLSGAYCWDSGLSGTLCVDPIPPSFEGMTPLAVDGPVRLVLDRPLPQELSVSLTPELFGDSVASETLDVGSTVEWLPDAPAGEYVLNVNARWKQGDVTYWFYVSVP